MDVLRSQVSKLEEENSKLSKAESERRKLELEVNYWKEYVTNSQALKRSGISLDASTELADTRRKLIQLQDELNETQKKLKMHTGKLLMQNKDLADSKERLREANSIIAVHKAKIEQLTKELSQKDHQKELITTASADEIFYSGKSKLVEKLNERVSLDTGAQHLEDKFLVLKDRLKRIEKELFLKSKELEKANESRSKVAKYTRSLLQELETRLEDNQRKLIESDQKCKNAETELAMERERRIKLEEGPRRRMSSVASPTAAVAMRFDPHSPPADLTEHDADTKYADYYRSRYKEVESSLLEKDKKLHQAEEKIKEIQLAMKSSSDSYKVLNDLQGKLSDATHKLSDRQLKIHELTREIDKLKEFEKTYERKSKKCETLEEIVKDLEVSNSVMNKNLHHSKQELEILKIREVVLKEQLQTFAEDSDSDDDEDEVTLDKSVDLKKKIECMIESEALVKKLTFDNEKLLSKNSELEARLTSLNMQSFKTLESTKGATTAERTVSNTEKDSFEKKIKELERTIAEGEDKFCNDITLLKQKNYNEITAIEKKNIEENLVLKKKQSELESEVARVSQVKIDLEGECNELRGKVTILEIKTSEIEEKLKVESQTTLNTQLLLTERSNLLEETEERYNRLMGEKDVIDGLGNESDPENLINENRNLKLKISKLERNLMGSVGSIEDIKTEKGVNIEGLGVGRDSGIVLSQEIQGLTDAFKKESNILEPVSGTRDDLDDLFFTPRSSVTVEPESMDKYKRLCVCYETQLKELSKKYVSSEEKGITLAEDLVKQCNSEEDYIIKYSSMETRMNDIQTQIIDSQESLQSKADELERERKNVINLVEVTSAYIKELEGSLAESKTKIQELQTLVELTKEGDRLPPDGSSGLSDKNDEIDNDITDSEDAKVIRQKLTAKIMLLQSDISELKVNHTNELSAVQGDAQLQIAKLRKQLSSAGMSEASEDLLLNVESLQAQLNEQNEL